jgi:hypothetical protein
MLIAYFHVDIAVEHSAQRIRSENLVVGLRELGYQVLPLFYHVGSEHVSSMRVHEVSGESTSPKVLVLTGHLYEFVRACGLTRADLEHGRIDAIASDLLGKCDELGVTHLVVSYPPLVGLQAFFRASKLGLRVKNVVFDLADPIVGRSDLRLNAMGRARYRRFERKVMGAASLILTTTSEHADALRAKYPVDSPRVVLLRQAGQRALASAASSYRYLYAGSFYESIRNPELILQAVSALDAQLHFAGPWPKWMRRDENRINYLGLLSYEGALSAMSAADVLVYLDNRPPGQIPGKIFDYLLNARKRIVFVTDRDALPRELSEYAGSFVLCRYEVGSIARSLLEASTFQRSESAECASWVSRARELVEAMGLNG